MCFSSPRVPDPQPIQQPPTQQDAKVTAAATEAQRRARSSAGAQSTILTSGTPAASESTRLANVDTESAPLLGKTLLGQ